MSDLNPDIYQILESQFNYVDGLNPFIQQALMDYTDTGFQDINMRLRNNMVLNIHQREIIDLIDKAFEGVPPIEHPITVYRGVRTSYIPDATAYVSTSHSPTVAKSFMGKYCCKLTILISPGSKVLPLEKISNAPWEKEILLPREGSFTVTNIKSDNPDGITSYNITYTPEKSVPLNEDTDLKKNRKEQPLGSEIETWVQRIVNLISPEELEIFGPSDAVNSVVGTSFKDYKIPEEAITIAITRLSNMQK